MKTFNYLLILFIVTIFFNCTQSKNFQINSTPDKALIMKHEKEKIDDSVFISYGKETPGNENISFWRKEKEHFITVEKRGFKKLTKRVTPDSEKNISFNLEPIEGVSENLFKKEKLLDGKFVLLPPNIEVTIHSGVGRLDKRKKSPEISQQVSEDFLIRFSRSIKNNTQILPLKYKNSDFIELWNKISPKIKKGISNINIKRLNYYGTPPKIEIDLNKLLLNTNFNLSPDYFLYILGKCTSETSGRKIGNVLFSILGAAHSGVMKGAYGISTYHDPSAFYPDSGTMILFYVIDAKSSEILYIEPYFSGLDITKEKKIDKLINRISTFPVLKTKKKRKK